MNHLNYLVHSPDAWFSFLTLSVLEIVLGIDNVIFLALVANRLEPHQQGPARFVGLVLALFIRVAFLWSVLALVHLSAPVFDVGALLPSAAPDWLRSLDLSWRDLILLAGGLFLVYKAISEIGAEILPLLALS
jgi:predicted tellurium resistance membrane protein TerC